MAMHTFQTVNKINNIDNTPIFLYVVNMRKYWNIAVFSLFLSFLIFILPSPQPPVKAGMATTRLNNIRYWVDPNYTRIVLDLSRPTSYKNKFLFNPYRLYIDLDDTAVTGTFSPLIINRGLVKKVRVGQHNKKTVRVVLDLNGKADYKIFPLPSPNRLVIDIYNRAQFSAKNIVRKIVIDPGHGGKDSGAIGKSGLMEKDIVLDVGLRLKKLIEEKLKVKVIMTRNKDIFIPLEERTAIANTTGADLFISIHTNANPSRRIRGVETYLLGKATDKSALATASRENSVSEKSLNDLQLILTDLLTTVKQDESLRLAHYIQSNIVKRLKPKYKVPDLGIKQAPFYVLVNARMPSILAEISFISNPREERLLARRSYRQEIAEAIFKGILNYIDSIPVFAYPKEAVNLPVQ